MTNNHSNTKNETLKRNVEIDVFVKTTN